MFATVRRYQSVDESRTPEITKKVDQTLMPRLSQLPGFGGYYLIESDKGVLTSFSLFETSAQADESGRVAAKWLKDEHLEAIVPEAPKVTGGTVLAHTTNTAILA
ncbi:MAG: hypothetical protein QOE98_2447 [Gaiellaceae bacterium]|nr:hypothetical protein [Gaiellaceae bacterium]